MRRLIVRTISCCAVLAMLTLTTGCPDTVVIGGGGRAIDRAAGRILAAVDIVQTEDVRVVELPPAAVSRGDVVTVREEVTVITDVRQQIVVERLPDVTLLGFENDTGFDIFVRYFADGVDQGIFVFDRETVLLEYPCLDVIELDTEDDFDPFTGEFVASFDLRDAVFFNPEDFICGDAFIITIDPFGVLASPEAIDLVD